MQFASNARAVSLLDCQIHATTGTRQFNQINLHPMLRMCGMSVDRIPILRVAFFRFGLAYRGSIRRLRLRAPPMLLGGL